MCWCFVVRVGVVLWVLGGCASFGVLGLGFWLGFSGCCGCGCGLVLLVVYLPGL